MKKLLKKFAINKVIAKAVCYILLAGLPALLACPVKAQRKILAQYPLEVEGNKTLRFYDVSGNGYHGKLINNSKETIASIFNADSLTAGVSCIKKLTTSDATIKVPPIYNNANMVQNGFSVSFWIYIDNNDTLNRTYLINLPQFTVVKTRFSTTRCRIGFFYPTQTKFSQLIMLPQDLINTGWYYFCISYGGNGSKDISYYNYYYNGVKYSASIDSLKGQQMPGNGTISDSIPTGEGTLLSAGFTGKIWNIKFYDKALTDKAEANDDRNDSWSLAMKQMDVPQAANYYLLRSVLSFYPCVRQSRDSAVLTDVAHGRNSIKAMRYSFMNDRFGNANQCLALQTGGYIALPLFTADYKASKGIDPMKGYTISFWTYIDQKYLPPQNSAFPYLPTDTCFQFFSLNNGTGNIGGLAMIRDRFVINRFTNKNPVVPWKLWLWDKVSFQNMTGWYHVIFAQKESAVRVMMYKPNGEAAARLNYFNAQDFAKLTGLNFNVGINPSEIPGNYASACKSIDDIRIYDWPFSQGEADRLHAYETKKP